MKQLIAFSLAVVLSFFLFVVMHLMINNEAHAYVLDKHEPIVITMNLQDPELILRDRIPTKPPELKPIKKQPELTRTKPEVIKHKPIKVALATGTTNGFQQSFQANIATNGALGRASGGTDNSSGLLPKIRIEPQYPIRASSEGQEGYVTLGFDVNQFGNPINIMVLDAKPRGYFEKNAKKALRKWKYSAKKENGKAVAVLNQNITLEFKLEAG